MVNKCETDIVCITKTWLSDQISDNSIATNSFTLSREDDEKQCLLFSLNLTFDVND